MKRMRSVYRLSILVLASLFTLTGCIMETLPECPPSLSFAPVFTYHTIKDAGGAYQDLFGETAGELTVYLFDKDGRFAGQFSQNGPFRNGVRIACPLTAAPGEYYAVMWVNRTSSTDLNLKPEQGVTTMQELLLSLKEINSGIITRQFEPLLYGKTALFKVGDNEATDQVIPVNLIRDTNKVQVTVRWRDKNSKELCTIQSHPERTRMYIQDSNGIMNFKNELCPCEWLTYLPRYFEGDALPPFPDSAHPDAATLAGEFSVMRLLTDSHPKLIFKTVDEAGKETPVAEYDLMEWIRKTKAYDTQESLDREEIFNVYLEFLCDGEHDNTWVAVNVTINGWTVSNMGDDGGDLQ